MREKCNNWQTQTNCDLWPATPLPPSWGGSAPRQDSGWSSILPDRHGGRTGIQFSPAPPRDNRVKWPSDCNESVCSLPWFSFAIPVVWVSKSDQDSCRNQLILQLLGSDSQVISIKMLTASKWMRLMHSCEITSCYHQHDDEPFAPFSKTTRTLLDVLYFHDKPVTFSE